MGNGKTISIMWRTMNNIVIITIWQWARKLFLQVCERVCENYHQRTIFAQLFIQRHFFPRGRKLFRCQPSGKQDSQWTRHPGYKPHQLIRFKMGWKNNVDSWLSKLPKEKLRLSRTFWQTQRYSRSPIKPHQNATLMGTWSWFSFLFLSG